MACIAQQKIVKYPQNTINGVLWEFFICAIYQSKNRKPPFDIRILEGNKNIS